MDSLKKKKTFLERIRASYLNRSTFSIFKSTKSFHINEHMRKSYGKPFYSFLDSKSGRCENGAKSSKFPFQYSTYTVRMRMQRSPGPLEWPEWIQEMEWPYPVVISNAIFLVRSKNLLLLCRKVEKGNFRPPSPAPCILIALISTLKRRTLYFITVGKRPIPGRKVL